MEEKKIDLTEESKVHKEVTVLDKGSLVRRIGTLGLYSIGYSDISSSIYYVLGVTTFFALGAAPIAILIAGIFFIFTALTYAELGSCIPEPGGACTFARRAFNDFWSFIAGWALLLDYIVTIAISAYTVGPYLSHLFPILSSIFSKIAFSIIIIGILAIINIIGIKESAGVSFTLCLFNNLTMLAIIVIGGIFLVNFPYLINRLQINAGFDWSPTTEGFIKGIVMAMVAYTGIEAITQVAGETKNPGRNIPRSIFFVVITLFIAYLGVCVVAFSSIHPKELATTYMEDPIAGITKSLALSAPQFSFFTHWVGLIAAAILFSAANSGLIGASRLTFAMGGNFQLPRFFYSLHPKFKTPYISILFFAGVSAIIILEVAGRGSEPLKYLAELYNFGAMLSFALAHISVIGLRIKEPELTRPFKIKPNIKIKGKEIPIFTILGLLATSTVWILVVVEKPAARYLGFLWMIFGIILYIRYRQKTHIPLMEKVVIEKVSIPGFTPLRAKNILVPIKGEGKMINLQTACKIAKEDNANITVLYVIEIPTHLPLDTFFPKQYCEADTILDQAEAIAEEWGITIEKKIVQARTAGSAIVEVTKEKNIDLIILEYSPKKFTIPEKVLPSTVEYVTKYSPSQVITIKI
jgi:APA family basic amino acid/polyamine antiporter